MGIRVTRDSEFQVASSAFRTAQSSFQRVSSNLNALNYTDQEEEGSGWIDPGRFLSGRELKKWESLPEQKRRRYIEAAAREVGRMHLPSGAAVREIGSRAAKEFQKDRQGKRRMFASRRRRQSIQMQERTGAGEPHIQDRQGSKAAMNAAESRIAQGGKRAASEGAGRTADAAVSSTGVGVAVVVAKRTAEKFKAAERQKKAAVEQRRVQLQNRLDEVRQSQDTNSLTGKMVAATAVAGTVLASAGAFFANILISMVMAVVSVLIPIVAITAFIGLVTTVVAVVVAVVAPAATDTETYTGTGTDIVEVALEEIGTKESGNNITKYGEWIGMNGQPWCHSFVSWCGNECGYISAKIIPKTAACETGRQWFIGHGRYQKAGESYIPKAGDIIYFDYGHEGVSHHVGIVEYAENGIVHTIEGNKSNMVRKCRYRLTDSDIMGYGLPEYPEESEVNPGDDSYGSGKVIRLPSGMGSVYTYMGWEMTTAKSSMQYRLRIKTGEKYDSNGFGKIGGRYVIACTTTYGKVGDEVDFVLKNGKVIHGVIGDIKNQDDPGCNKWGHQNGKCVVEFCVKKSSWYGTSKTVTRYHPEWGNTTVVKVINLGKNHL